MTEDIRTYYGQPVLKQPAWTWEVPWYLFVGGLAGVSSAAAAVARGTGNAALATRAERLAAAGAVIGPALLVKDLGRPRRFLNMLRVLRPTSAMSVGSWVLASWSGAASGGAVLGAVDRLPRLRALLRAAAAALGFPMATYTGVLLADSSIPVWHEARRELPFLFAASGAATAAAAMLLGQDSRDAAAARRLAVGGAVAELVVDQAMERRLGELGDVYAQGDAGAFGRVAKACTAAGAGLLAVAGRRRVPAAAGASLLLAGGACLRWSVYRAGFASAASPAHVIKPQRARLDAAAGERTPQV